MICQAMVSGRKERKTLSGEDCKWAILHYYIVGKSRCALRACSIHDVVDKWRDQYFSTLLPKNPVKNVSDEEEDNPGFRCLLRTATG